MNMEGDQLKPSIGFIGMGHMGSHMAQRLLEAGYRLTVYLYMLPVDGVSLYVIVL